MICKEAFKNRGSAKYLELKQNFQADFSKNLDDYEMFSQVQLKYNNSGDYFVADQIFVKYDAFGDVEDMRINYLVEEILLQIKQMLYKVIRLLLGVIAKCL